MYVVVTLDVLLIKYEWYRPLFVIVSAKRKYNVFLIGYNQHGNIRQQVFLSYSAEARIFAAFFSSLVEYT